MLYVIIEPSWKVSINVNNYYIVHDEEVEVYNRNTYLLEEVYQI